SADTSKYGVSGAVAAVGCFVASPRRLGRAYVAFPIGPDVIPAGVKLTSARIDFSLQAMPEGTATVEVWNSIGSVFAGAYAIEVPTVPNDNAYNPPADSPDWGETFANEGSGFSTGDAFLTYLDAKLAHLEDDDRIEVQLRAANATVASKCKDTEHRFHLDGTALVVAYSW
ncbi:MAG TPA: hypothetical protein VLC09_03850, partial [Polyangiaceae bacterium]|nr:hypothetical protein [Polyangiaceae bacterium]